MSSWILPEEAFRLHTPYLASLTVTPFAYSNFPTAFILVPPCRMCKVQARMLSLPNPWESPQAYGF